MASPSPKLTNRRVAVVGCGYWGKNLVRNFAELGALASVCDSDKSRLGTLRDLYPDCLVRRHYADLLEDSEIEAVAVATPAETHGELVRQALLADKDVLVEKPLCLDVSVGRELVDLAEERGRILMVGHLLWYHPAILELRRLIREGELGRIQYIYSNRLNLGRIRREENILWSFAPHDVSVILGLLDEMPESVVAQSGNYLHERIADVTVSLLSFASGVRAHIFVSWLHPFKEQKLVVVGDRRMAVFDDIASEKLVLYPHTIDWKNQIPVASKAAAVNVPVDASEPLRNECQHFLDRLADRQLPRTDGADGLRVLEVLSRCQIALEAPAENKQQTSRPTRSYFVHESAFIDEDVEIGDGCKIWHVSHILSGSRLGKDCNIGQNVVVGPNVRVGDGVKIQNNVCVYEGVTLEDHVFCGPSMVFTNVVNPRSEVSRKDEFRETLVREGVTLGANCTILCGITLGRYAFVGAGAVVLDDVPDHALVVGNPAVVKGWVCMCGERLTFSEGAAECECGRRLCQKNSVVQLVDFVEMSGEGS